MSSYQQPKVLSFRSSSQIARNFYKKMNAMPLWDHCHRVFKRACDVKMLESSSISDDPVAQQRALLNNLLGETMFYHVVNHKAINAIKNGELVLEFNIGENHPLMNPEVSREIEVFGRLTELDRRGASLADYMPLLNN